MTHILIVGQTLSGKSYLAKTLARSYRGMGFSNGVLDPIVGERDEWAADLVTDNQKLFLDWFWKSRNCFVFMDEAGESVGRYNDAMTFTATRGRHNGHVCHYICQYATQLPPIVRAQCTRLFLFHSSAREGERLAEDFSCPELLGCVDLPRGHYFRVSLYGSPRCTREVLFDDSNTSRVGSPHDSAGNLPGAAEGGPQQQGPIQANKGDEDE